MHRVHPVLPDTAETHALPLAWTPITGGTTYRADNIMLSRLALLSLASTVLGSALPLQPDPEPVKPNTTVAKVGVSLEEKQVADAAAFSADKVVTQLELQRDAAWQTARGNLAVATNPPIRSSAVLGMLTAETDKFASLEVCALRFPSV